VIPSCFLHATLTLLAVLFLGHLDGQFEVAMTIIALRMLRKGWNIEVVYIMRKYPMAMIAGFWVSIYHSIMRSLVYPITDQTVSEVPEIRLGHTHNQERVGS
jgi:hypothetical protein